MNFGEASVFSHAVARRIFVRDHALLVSIGVHEHERRAVQRLLVSVDVDVSWDMPPHPRPPAQWMDGDGIRHVIAVRLARGHIQLQETLCDDIAAALLSHAGVQAVRVETMKRDVYLDCDGVGVEVFRTKCAAG